MDYTLLALSIAPAAAIIIYVYLKDKYEKEPHSLLLKCFFGGALSIILAIALEALAGAVGLGVSQNPMITMTYAFGVVGLSEELSKYWMVRRIAYRHPAFNEPFDGIVYCVMVSMGFATLENILYAFHGGYETAVARMFTAVPAHATFAAIMGFFMGIAKFKGTKALYYNSAGLLGAVLFHGAYDYFLFEKNYPGIYMGAFASLAVGISLSRKAMRIHQEGSPFRQS